MPAVNTYDTYHHHTLNDYRLSVEPAYEVGSSSKVGAGLVIAAIFLGVGAYLYFSSNNSRSVAASSDTNYQAPAVTNGALPTDAVDNVALADTNAATSPTMLPAEPSAAGASAQDSVANRTITDSSANAVPTRPVQRTTQPAKPAPKSTNNAATLAPELSTPAPTIAPEPTAVDQATEAAPESSDIPSPAATDAAPSDEAVGSAD